MREKRSVGWNTRPNGGVCISIIKCVAKLRKEELQDIQWMVFVGKQTRRFSSMAAIGTAVQSIFQDGARKWSRSKKTTQGRRGLTREMQFARTLDRRRAILDEGFELIECWEHDFKERPQYPKKKKDTFPHALGFDIEALLDTSKRKRAMKDLLFESEHVPMSVSLADILDRVPEYISSKDPKELIRRF